MADDIELVIKIPEKEYNIIKKFKGPMTWAEHLIKKGMPLPKGHGRLIDANDLLDNTCLDEIPTVIEADKGESEDKI